MSFTQLIRKPSAFIPVAMSLFCVAMLAYVFVRFGLVRQQDEGTPAHLFQLLMGGQLPIIAYFAIRWLPRFPKQALGVLALQALAALAAMFPVFYFQL
ncbi:MAG: hypothetical protein ACM3MF_01430 [Anaerolineae bacterium]